MAQGRSPQPVTRRPPRPRFSIVSAAYNVARYLPDFIGSVEGQTFPLARVQVVVVDDGSTDESLDLLRAWESRRPDLVTVVTKPNGGQGSARNLGIEHATGEWITFTDPDDMVDAAYLRTVDEFLNAHPETEMVATNRILYFEDSGERAERHPMRRMYGSDQLVDLRRFPDFFQNSAPASFFRTEVLRDTHLQFDDRVQPIFEDGHFCIRYMLSRPTAYIGFLKSAEYIYRKRADGTSTLQNALRDVRRFIAVPRHGYLAVLELAKERYGTVPEWLQNFILYDLSWFFSADMSASGAETACVGPVADEFLAILGDIVSHLEPHVVESFSVRRFDPDWRDILLHALGGGDWSTPYAVLLEHDRRRKLVRIAYRYVGRPPAERVLHRGREVEVEHGKVRALRYFSHDLLHERIVWVPAKGALRVFLDGRPVELRDEWLPQTVTTVRPSALAARFQGPAPVPTELKIRDLMALRLARTPAIRRLFRNAWVVMDRLHDADDNGERLFEHLRKHKRRINAWFVLEKGTPDWQRMKAAGHRRLVPHGGIWWQMLMLNARHLVSSHADVQVTQPTAIMRLTGNKQPWSFSFLQHGVIKDDLSLWLNPKNIALFVTSTPDEQRSIVGDGTNYRFTTLETRMTGLPRFDRLREVGARVRPEERRLILVTPTWRHWLIAPGELNTHRRSVLDNFLSTEYAQNWLSFLSHATLRSVAADNDLQVCFMPHPNLQSVLAELPLPSNVRAVTFSGEDVQDLIAHAAVLVTDFSSMVFNAAYIDRPSVYFQFDGDRVLNGAHVGRRGYFDYRRDGFGPVTETVEDAVHAVRETVEHGREPGEPFRSRIAATFPERDGRCCERVVNAIEALR